MVYIVDSDKSFYEASVDLAEVVLRLGFEVLHAHDLGAMLRSRDIDCDDDCTTFDICNYRLTEKLLAIDMRLGLLMPYRISVYTEEGNTKIGLVRPQSAFAAISGDARLARVAGELEEKMIQIVDEAR